MVLTSNDTFSFSHWHVPPNLARVVTLFGEYFSGLQIILTDIHALQNYLSRLGFIILFALATLLLVSFSLVKSRFTLVQ